MNVKPKDRAFFNNVEWYPFNPKATDAEYRRISTLLELHLKDRSEFGFSQSCSSQTSDGSRSVMVEVLDSGQWNRELIENLQQFLSDLVERYCIILTDNLEDRFLGGCFMLISPDKIEYWFRDPAEAEAFWSGTAFSDPEGTGKQWSEAGWIAP